MEEQDIELYPEEDIEASFAFVLEAVERLGEELASRSHDDAGFTVSVPDDPPVVRVLAELINDLGRDIEAQYKKNNESINAKSQELSNAYNELQKRNEDVHTELEMARKIQTQLIPSGDEFPAGDYLGFGGFYQTMENIGGDIYDVIRVGRNSYGVLIADVSGHGIPAALITALVKIAFRNKSIYGVPPSQVCREVNDDLYPILSQLDFFVTAFFGILDLETGEMQFTNCGHHPSVVFRDGEDEPIFLDTRGRFLGFFDDPGAEDDSFTMQAGDLLFMYTDGIIEARNFFDQEYQAERLHKALAICSRDRMSAADSIEAVQRDMTNFCMGADQRDDQSMFAMKISEGYHPKNYGKHPPDLASEDSSRQSQVQNQNSINGNTKNQAKSQRTGLPSGYGKHSAASVLKSRIHQALSQAADCMERGENLKAAGMLQALSCILPENTFINHRRDASQNGR